MLNKTNGNKHFYPSDNNPKIYNTIDEAYEEIQDFKIVFHRDWTYKVVPLNKYQDLDPGYPNYKKSPDTEEYYDQSLEEKFMITNKNILKENFQVDEDAVASMIKNDWGDGAVDRLPQFESSEFYKTSRPPKSNRQYYNLFDQWLGEISRGERDEDEGDDEFNYGDLVLVDGKRGKITQIDEQCVMVLFDGDDEETMFDTEEFYRNAEVVSQ
jgi:hypothetical protein